MVYCPADGLDNDYSVDGPHINVTFYNFEYLNKQ